MVCRHTQEGWPNSMYGVSKLCQATYTRCLANELKGVTVSACCPGYVDTDMTSHRGWKTITQVRHGGGSMHTTSLWRCCLHVVLAS